ncbi:MAG: Rossmann-like and DUF2520 domain-containing protein [Flavicella sp.]
MVKISIIGYGNVGSHLLSEFAKNPQLEIVQIYNRNIQKIPSNLEDIAVTDSIKSLKEADIYFLTVNDDTIASVAKQLSNRKELIVHTSGAVSVDVFKNSPNYGVFYPLQSFTMGKTVDFNNIPICLEANSKKNLAILEQVASSLSKRLFQIDSQQRKQLHVAAVFVNNFVNHLYSMGEAICERYEIPFEILHPLILETAKKVQHFSPKQVQTGPAIRGDQKTIESHKKNLTSEQATVYSLLSEYIQNNA